MIRPPFPEILDSTMVATFRSCPHKFFWEYLHHWKSAAPSVHLVAGGAYAKGLETTREAFYVEGCSEETAIAKGLAALLKTYGNFQCPPDSAKSAERTAGAFEYYFTQYPLHADAAQPIALPGGKRGIEFSFAEPLDAINPETGSPILYVGRMDMICDYAGGRFGLDDKTTSSLGASWSKQWDLRSQFTGYCLLPGTEVLTPSGWVALESLQEGVPVVQWDKSGIMSWTCPTEIHKPYYEGDLVSCDGKVSFVSTPEHRQVVFDTYGGKWKDYTSSTLPKTSGALRFISAGKLEGGLDFPEAFVQFLVAIQADGSWKDGGVRFHFTKKRKADRLEMLADALDLPIAWHGTNDYSIQFPGNCEWVKQAYELLGEKKLFGKWLLQLGQESLQTFIEEVAYWDGSERGSRGWMYFTTQRDNAEWVRTVASITGHYSSVHCQDGWKSDNVQYRVNITEGCQHSPHLHTYGTIPYKGFVYCLTVPTSYFLIRYNGRTMVTGNCWGAAKAGIPLQGFLVRGLSILKTKYDTQQAITYRPSWMIDRWYGQLLRDVERMQQMWASGVWDYSLDHACTEYSGCAFRQPCLSAEPQPWLETSFVRRIWNPLTREEKEVS